MPFCDVGGLRIYHEIAGEGAPLLLINGLACDTRLWQPIVARLSGSFRVISYDMRCAGRSESPKDELTIEKLADEARELLLKLETPRARVLGFSMGGMVAMQLASKHPEAVERLTLVSTTPCIDHPVPADKGILAMLHRTDICDELLEGIFMLFFGSDYRDRVTLADYINFRMREEHLQTPEDYIRQLVACERFDIVGRIGSIEAPTEIIVGAEDRIFPPSVSEWMRDRIQSANLTIVPRAGHMLPVEAIDEVVRAV